MASTLSCVVPARELIDELLAGRARPRPELAQAHLARFSFDAFVERLQPIVADAVAYTSCE